MKFCAIIPDRNDRPELTEHCLWQLSIMTRKPDKIYHINYHPESERFDLTERIKRGWLLAKSDGMDWCSITENDDHYPSDYFETVYHSLPDNVEFIGDQKSIYYNLRNQTYQTFEHKLRSSLYTTSFKTSALNDFQWPNDNSPFLDIKLWEYAVNLDSARLFRSLPAVGIKHALGKCGGKGHKMTLANTDVEMIELKSLVDKKSFEFYKNLIK